MKTNKFLILPLLATSLVACNSGSTAVSQTTSPNPKPTAKIPAKADLLGSIFGVVEPGQESIAKTFQYFTTVTNIESSTLSLVSVTALDANGVSSAAAFRADSKACESIESGATCKVRIRFKPTNIVTPADLNSLINLQWSNGQTSSLPIYGVVLNAESGVGASSISMPNPIVIGKNGNALVGRITYVNATNDTQTIDASAIATSPTIAGNTWKFSADCDGKGHNTVAAYGTCSIRYKFSTDVSCIYGSCPIYNIVVPVTDVESSSPNFGKVTYLTANTSLTKNLDPLDRRSIIGNYGGAVPVNGTSGIWSFTNLGNATLTGLSFTGLGALSQTNTCDQIIPGTSCFITFTLPAGSTAPDSVQVQPANNICQGLDCGGATIPVTQEGLAVSVVAQEFGTNTASSVLTQSVWISNLSTLPLSPISVALTGDSAFTMNVIGNGSLLPFRSFEVFVTYTAPSTSGAQSAVLTVSTPGQSTKTVRLSGASAS